MGSTFAGSHVSSTPLTVTLYVSGSTRMSGRAVLSFMSALERLRHPMTAASCLVRPYSAPLPAATHALDTKATDVLPGAMPLEPNIGRMTTGSGVGIDALASPICATAMVPPLITICGLAPKNAGFHSTRSAILPTSTLPMRCDMPCATAGLMVYFATYRLTRSLSATVPLSRSSWPLWRFILSAVCHVRHTTSPTLPMACESLAMMDIAPMSCSTSSAAMVSPLMRLSAKATSSGMFLSRWWHTMSMSRCSSSVFLVKGLVGLVDDGSTLGTPHTLMMSGACPPPAPSEWYVWMVRPLNAPTESSTQHDSFSVSVWIVTWTSSSSHTDRQVSMAAGVVPQSSCSFSPTAPASMTSRRPCGVDVLPLPVKAKLMGMLSVAWSIIFTCAGDGVHVVAHVPCAGPVPPPRRVVIPLASASSAICGQM
mmetsp:Transcript_4792/g.16709  ORF Transcript_4792/g.16709 Transcript_4792/m.16709 type:complete len:425 (+) Transcript_4792:39-1313(+)